MTLMYKYKDSGRCNIQTTKSAMMEKTTDH